MRGAGLCWLGTAVELLLVRGGVLVGGDQT